MFKGNFYCPITKTPGHSKVVLLSGLKSWLCILEGESGRDRFTASAEPLLAVSNDLFLLVAPDVARKGPADAVNWSLPLSPPRMQTQKPGLVKSRCADMSHPEFWWLS